MSVIDRVRQPRISQFAVRVLWAFSPVVAGAADADQLAKPLHLEQVTIVINKPAATHLVVSFAKYTAARFKIS